MEQIQITKDIYKVYQLMEYFTAKYSFKNIMVKNLINTNEIWLANPDNKDFNIIRISNTTLDSTFMDKSRIENYISLIEKTIRQDARFIDIHIGNEEVMEEEIFHSISINTNYYSGDDISYEFIGIQNVVHDVDNPEAEIAQLLSNVNTLQKQSVKQKREVFKQKFHIRITLTSLLIALCCCNYICTLYLSNTYDLAVSQIVMGANYKFFTIGLGQFYRLFTYAFVHGSLIHLVLNMYSLFILGNYFEQKIGPLKYGLILLFGIVIGGLSQTILTGVTNDLSIGMSSGIYALFTLYIIDAMKMGAYRDKTFLFIIFLNLMLNFMSTVAWQAHIGGAIAGILFYFILKDKKTDVKLIVLLVILIGALSYKAYTVEKITPMYSGTDVQVLEVYYDYGFENYTKNLNDKISNYYLHH